MQRLFERPRQSGVLALTFSLPSFTEAAARLPAGHQQASLAEMQVSGECLPSAFKVLVRGREAVAAVSFGNV